MLSYETIERDTIWVAKMNGWRTTGTYEEIGHLAGDDECRDFDLLYVDGQPEHLRKFFNDYNKQPYDNNRKYFLQDFYDVWVNETDNIENEL